MSSPKMEDHGLQSGIAVVTGGSRGIGRAVVKALASAGMDVVFTYRENEAAAAEVVVESQGLRVASKRLDVRDSTACNTLIEELVDAKGRIDVLVNNAGIIKDNPLAMLDDEDIRIVLETNVTGTFNMSRAVAPHMISQRQGTIINISSVAGEKGGRGQTNYAASKGAINAFTRSLAVELAPRGIRVNAVAPGVIETEMSRDVRERAADAVKSRILLRRVGQPEEVAYAVMFLASRYASYITGEILNVDGGFKME
jgi:3-oxoacyl-[acyl-carrier protein] reductase